MKIRNLSAFAGAILLTACSHSSNNQHPSNILRIDVGSEAPTLDPALVEDAAAGRIINDLFAGLVDFDQQNNPIAGMAESWDISSDQTRYTFHLRSELKFSDGSPISAQDFVYTYRRVVDPKTASGHNYLLADVKNGNAIISGKLPPDQLGITAPDAKTVVIELEHPDENFLNYLTLGTVGVVKAANLQQYGNDWTKPGQMVTSGAYKLSEHIVNGHITVVKNPYYYAAAQVTIPEIQYFPFVDHNSGLSAYKSGAIDLVYQSVPIDQYRELKSQYPDQLHTIRQEAIYYYDLNQLLPELKNNPKLRQALTMAIDRQTLVDKILGQGETPLYANVTPTIESGAYAKIGYSWRTLPFNEQLQQAKALYAQAGYSATKPLKLTLTYNPDDLNKKVALTITAMWKSNLGADISIAPQEWKTFLANRHSGNYQLARDRWVADYNSVTSYTQLFVCHGVQNNSQYCNPAYDRLIAAAAKTQNPAEKIALNTQALNLVLNDYAIIPLFQPNYSKLIKPYVKNLDIEHNYYNVEQSKWISLAK